jgi:hypothetical protein
MPHNPENIVSADQQRNPPSAVPRDTLFHQVAKHCFGTRCAQWTKTITRARTADLEPLILYSRQSDDYPCSSGGRQSLLLQYLRTDGAPSFGNFQATGNRELILIFIIAVYALSSRVGLVAMPGGGPEPELSEGAAENDTGKHQASAALAGTRQPKHIVHVLLGPPAQIALDRLDRSSDHASGECRV